MQSPVLLRVGQRRHCVVDHLKTSIGTRGTISFVHENGLDFTVITDEGFCEWARVDHWPPVETRTYFVSGHLDLTADEFNMHYAPRIVEALTADTDAAFVVGDARGCDRMTQIFLRDSRVQRVQVFHMLEEPRNNEGFPTVCGFTTDRARDEAMTAISDVAIAWVRQGRAHSGTAANLARRGLKKA